MGTGGDVGAQDGNVHRQTREHGRFARVSEHELRMARRHDRPVLAERRVRGQPNPHGAPFADHPLAAAVLRQVAGEECRARFGARESARDDGARQASADLYRRAIKARVAVPAAHVGLARVLLDLNDTNGALTEIDAARRDRPSFPEASAVEGRIYRETGQIDDAIGAFNRAIRESHGFQPEAHVGLGRTYEEKGHYELAAREFDIAIKQLSDTEPIIYQLLGAAYEKSGNNREAIAAYENYLRLAPNGSQASAVRSIVDQLKSQQPEN